jgi:cysteinyl-tRNA synthetase
MDRGDFRAGDRAAFLDTLERWDRIFAVLEDNDHEKLVKLGLAKSAQVLVAETSPFPASLGAVLQPPNGRTSAAAIPELTDEEIGRRVAERNEMRRKGDFARADEIRQNLQKAGVILEDSKAGTRWKRK